jgi:hypothetical protein
MDAVGLFVSSPLGVASRHKLLLAELAHRRSSRLADSDKFENSHDFAASGRGRWHGWCGWSILGVHGLVSGKWRL